MFYLFLFRPLKRPRVERVGAWLGRTTNKKAPGARGKKKHAASLPLASPSSNPSPNPHTLILTPTPALNPHPSLTAGRPAGRRGGRPVGRPAGHAVGHRGLKADLGVPARRPPARPPQRPPADPSPHVCVWVPLGSPPPCETNLHIISLYALILDWLWPSPRPGRARLGWPNWFPRGFRWFPLWFPPGFRFGFRLASAWFPLVSAGPPPCDVVSAWFPLASAPGSLVHLASAWLPPGFRWSPLWVCPGPAFSSRPRRPEHLVSATALADQGHVCSVHEDTCKILAHDKTEKGWPACQPASLRACLLACRLARLLACLLLARGRAWVRA